MMNYCEALDKLGSLHYLGSKLGLNRMEPLLDAVANPQDTYPVVHVAGTKGKGSTSLMIANILHAAGLKTGLFTSPHLQSLRERVRINGQMITTGDFASLVNEVWQASIPLAGDWGPATFFEVSTTMAFLHFMRENIDAGVLEVGLGGRLDATNVIKNPTVTVITPISYDHMVVLGDTLDRIAREKAGIIKPNCPLVLSKQRVQALDVILEIAKERNSEVSLQGKDFDFFDRGVGDGEGQMMDYKSSLGDVDGIKVPLLGEHQLQNASVAIRTAQVFASRTGRQISDEAIRKGVSESFWPCRLEVIPGKPYIILDGAHNGASADALAHALRRHFKYNKLSMVVGILRDKDSTRFIRALAPMADNIIATTSTNYRSLDCEKLCLRFNRKFYDCKPIKDPVDAVVSAIEQTPCDGAVLVTGSLYLVGQIRTHLGRFSLAK
jgi:dihydrofolate synthase/folylpolyglutamate synthase